MLELDRYITLALNGSDNIFMDNLMMTITNTWSWTLVIITLLYVIFKNKGVYEFLLILFAMILMITVADRLCSGLIKPLVARWRPTQDPQIMYLVDVVDGYRGGRFGFFSGHACNTFCMATFMSMLFRHHKLSFILFIWALSTTYTRIYLGVHYVGDVTVGMLVGMLIGLAFYMIYDKISYRFGLSRFSSSQFTVTGYYKTDMNLLMTIIFLNYILVVIFSMFRGI